MAEIEKAYEPLRKKHNLPPFVEIDEEFEISAIESERFLLRGVRRKMAERLDELCAFLEEMLQPDTNISFMYESRVFDDAEKKRVFSLYKKLMYFKRMCNEISITNEKQLDAEFIKKFFSSWGEIKKEASILMKKLKDSWLEDIETKADLPYFG